MVSFSEHERQKLAKKKDDEPPSSKDVRRQQRAAQRDVEQAESRIASLEARIAEVTAALEDPELYTRPDGATHAARLGTELEQLKSELEQTFAAWTAATETLESIAQ